MEASFERGARSGGRTRGERRVPLLYEKEKDMQSNTKKSKYAYKK